MKYEVIHPFADLNDNKYKYETGDKFPRPGLEVSEDRIKELSGSKNKARTALIAEIPEKAKDAAKEPKKKNNTKRKSKNADRTV